MQANAAYFKFAAPAATHAARLRLFRADLACENYMIQRGMFRAICADCGVLPLVDMCCDALGANALCPFHYSAAQDATAQDFAGWPVLCNPPYKEVEPFIRRLEADSRRGLKGTRAILVIPHTAANATDSAIWRLAHSHHG